MKASRLIITLDIETYGGAHKPTEKDIKVPSNYKKQESIDAYIKSALPEAHGKQALHSLKGEIICIGVAFNDEDPILLMRGATEKDLMTAFKDKVNEYVPHDFLSTYWVGHNLSGFDLPWLLHRAWKYNLPSLYTSFPMKKYDEHLIDTMVLFGGTSREMYSLNDVAKFLGVGGKTDGVDGSMMHQMFLDGKTEEIGEYCINDVNVTREVAKRLIPEIW